ncbi:MAG: hypothetical protein HY537_14230 [Deltaproteobacteria bacterium]|nr:hypothetical protein [Deltaproteobacteria bacterium]
MLPLVKLLFVFLPAVLWAEGSYTVIDKKPTPASGTIELKATVTKKVSLSVRDTASNNLVQPTGIIDFGDVDADGTPGSVPGIPAGPGKARYEADFIFAATRSGSGNVTLSAERSVAGTFNAFDGVLITDDGGTLQPLSGTGGAVTVIESRPEGEFTKKLGVIIYSADSGVLTSTLRFTLSIL